MNDRLIVITAERILQDEVALWVDILKTGLYRLHVRKPSAGRQVIAPMITQIPVELRKNVVIHHHVEIAERFGLGGVHLKYREATSGINVPISCSVHNWEEARTITPDYAYYFMSPVFDSISKINYKQNDDLKKVPADLQNKRVYALGGVDDTNAGMALEYGYHGVTALGYIWTDPAQAAGKVKELLRLTNDERMRA